MKKGDLVILRDNLYEKSIIEEWGIGIIINLAPDYFTAYVFWPKKGFDKVFHIKALMVLCAQ